VSARIYIVDDDQAVRDSVQSLLEIYGYEVQTFPSGAAFLHDFDGRGGACVIADVFMPGMSGIELLRALRKSRPDIPVIMISGRSERLSKDGLMSQGAADFLPKPFSDTAMVAAIESALARSGDQSA
jgi:two-component system response regulator FixJ